MKELFQIGSKFWETSSSQLEVCTVQMVQRLGGPGAIFWMWLIAFFGAATAFFESTLAQVYKVKDEEGGFRGGPAYYMEKGLNQRWLGLFFAVLILIIAAQRY